MIYLKDIDGIPTTAPSELKDETGFYSAFNQNVEAMTAKGYLPFNEEDHAQYIVGAKLFINGEFIENTAPEYIQDQKDQKAEITMTEYLSALSQFDITWTRNVVLGKKTVAQMNTARSALIATWTQKLSEV